MFSLAEGCCIFNFPIKVYTDSNLIITFAMITDRCTCLAEGSENECVPLNISALRSR